MVSEINGKFENKIISKEQDRNTISNPEKILEEEASQEINDSDSEPNKSVLDNDSSDKIDNSEINPSENSSFPKNMLEPQDEQDTPKEGGESSKGSGLTYLDIINEIHSQKVASDELNDSSGNNPTDNHSELTEGLSDANLKQITGIKRKLETEESVDQRKEFKSVESDTNSPEEEMTFSDAEKRIRKLNKVPADHDVMLAYSLYKQSTEGDNNTEYPLPLDFVGRAKWETWNELKGLAKEEARKKYIKLVKRLELDS